MKIFKNFIVKHGSVALLCSVVLVMSCTDKFEEINTNKNALAKLETSQLPFLFSAAQQNGTNSGWAYRWLKICFMISTVSTSRTALLIFRPIAL